MNEDIYYQEVEQITNELIKVIQMYRHEDAIHMERDFLMVAAKFLLYSLTKTQENFVECKYTDIMEQCAELATMILLAGEHDNDTSN